MTMRSRASIDHKGIDSAAAAVRHAAQRFTGARADYRRLLDAIGEARLVLIGEATHGTHEFYQMRAEITKNLIEERSFNAVAVEADWPDAYRVNRYVRRTGDDADGESALNGFKRFPTWMWRNADVLDFVTWLRSHNDATLPSAQAGFYGLDIYSLYASIEAVLGYLARVDPEGARRARARYACFDHFGRNTQVYGHAAARGFAVSCENEVVAQLLELRRHAVEYAGRDGRVAADDFFHAEQNARLIRNAEEYYRSMFRDDASSWNLRDRHMADTLEHLVAFLRGQGQQGKVVVWEHNSHIGDARATEMTETGEITVGQLVRERYQEQALLIGFTTYRGTVTAATDWDQPAERKHVRPALEGSYEDLFHNAGPEKFLIDLRDPHIAELHDRRLERAIGVVYRPETERASHYFYADLPSQFDLVLHIDETSAVEPLEPTPAWRQAQEAPETFPTGV
jgi:erythromycin esterase-like protein